ncbi:MAG: lytic transglycosylase, partial [Winogradskyella sp.]|nr:lytic transglycosylase [Winogradskyella sp.]
MSFRSFGIAFIYIFSISITNAQETADSLKTKKTVDPKANATKDSLIDGKSLNSKKIPVQPDTLSINQLQDLESAKEIDEKWLEELYSTAIFDTIYKSVVELDYEPVEYPELTTDTLKARLKRLNARTPFNVEYNPSLES